MVEGTLYVVKTILDASVSK